MDVWHGIRGGKEFKLRLAGLAGMAGICTYLPTHKQVPGAGFVRGYAQTFCLPATSVNLPRFLGHGTVHALRPGRVRKV